ncbi:MAG: thiol peroxidase [Elusimicrobiaceae bacterium]|jgi:thioredoxin-dependent peroxiredoxin|nr:thiol peroxidase [Elusimicrobiaceae bacterium]MBT3955212.1 thiol peroxidase [Elusimicrobiaceae bacterium]MBT4007781.1 thiol peroxidase [Elusimicrobiaceae bacterium]MBT4403310.1 thiol peroxidase [Elusimicrobiaceae bacterium]MBT4440384.1 thiol peroxidase [Elusimicrobiaceae bacterium]
MKTITLSGNAMHLEGNCLKVGDTAPDFTLLDTNLKPVHLKDYKGEIVVLSTVPSLDTPTCDTETRTFNKKATELSENVNILTVSKDLPFAQKRWCAAAGVDRVKTLSDYKPTTFAKDYGILIKELQLLTRAVFIIDENQKIKYIQFVEEVSEEPNYEEILKNI